MINEKHICINGKPHMQIEKLNSVPTPGKNIQIDGEKLVIRCCLRYVDSENDITNLYIDLIKEDKK